MSAVPPSIPHAHHHQTVMPGPWPDELDTVLSEAMMVEAQTEIADWPGYAPTPLHALDGLAPDLNVAAVHYKDEGHRFHLGSFKALGGAYAVLHVARAQVRAATGTAPEPAALRKGLHADALRDFTVCTATDGNHGRSVAWGAQMVGCQCRIYIHAHVSEGRQRAMEALGAQVVRIDGDYDASVRQCGEDAKRHGWQVVSDTSYDGYMDVPRWVMAGYSVMASEVLNQLSTPPTHVFIQAGVGGVAAAVTARFWQHFGANRPKVVIVEPVRAACLLASAKAGRATPVALEEETVMAGLSCGEPSLLAWEVLSRGADDFITIGEDAVAPAMRALADGTWADTPIVAGESAVPGLIGAWSCANDPAMRTAIGLDPNSRILTFGCEGATDPAIYEAMVGRSPSSVETATLGKGEP